MCNHQLFPNLKKCGKNISYKTQQADLSEKLEVVKNMKLKV